MFLAIFLLRLLPLPPLTGSGFFNRMPKVFKPEVLNYFTLPHFILRILSLSRNPILTHLPFSRSIDSLFCNLITPTTILSNFFNSQVLSVSTEKLVLPVHARCVLSHLCCNGHSHLCCLLLNLSL